MLELADIRIPPGQQAEFDAAIRKSVETAIARAKGFRGSAACQAWRAIVEPFRAAPPAVGHFDRLAKSA